MLLPNRMKDADGLFSQESASRGLFLLADASGSRHMRGQDVCQQVLSRAKDTLLGAVTSEVGWDEQTLHTQMVETMHALNQQLYDLNQRETNVHAMVLMAIQVDMKIYISHVGGIRAYVLSTEEGLEQVSHHGKRLALLGDQEGVEPETFAVELQPGSLLILGTDGVWGGISRGTIKQLVKSERSSPTLLAHVLADRRPCTDHRAVIVLQF